VGFWGFGEHGSIFNLEGNPIKEPAIKPLKAFKTVWLITKSLFNLFKHEKN